MQLRRLVSGTIAALALASLGSVALNAEQKTPASTSTVAAPAKASAPVKFDTLKQIKAEPMAAKELEAVKGQHVHFLDPGGNALHLAGDIKTENNWENLGGTDGMAVAPSYHGLCVSSGLSGPSAGAILIPGGETQCPL